MRVSLGRNQGAVGTRSLLEVLAGRIISLPFPASRETPL